MVKQGYYKVAECGFSTTTATFYNPETKDSYTETIWDNDDYRVEREHEEEYNMRIDEEVRKQWLHDRGVISVGDMVKVVKGRTLEHGYTNRVTAIKPYYDRYHRPVADYVYFADGKKINIGNVELA